MTTVATVTLRVSDFALAETLSSCPELELRVESIVGEGPLQAMPLVWFADVGRADLERAIETDPTIDRAVALLENPAEREWLYRIEYSDRVGDVCSPIFEHEGTILDAQVADDRWTLRLLFPRRSELSSAVSAMESVGCRVNVTRMVDAGRDGDLEVGEGLTSAQEEAITEAYQRGYYDVPREISLEDLAAELGISHQALSERLRRANKVLAGDRLDETATRSVVE